MKKLFFVLLVFVACSSIDESAVQFGEELTLKQTTAVSELLSNPENYVDEKVLVEGTVLEVCEMMGCWIEVSGDTPDQKIRVKVEDGVITFPQSAVGHKVVAEGKFEKIEMTQEEAINYKKHVAEERGEEFDPASVTGPEVHYRIWGSGAKIEGISPE